MASETDESVSFKYQAGNFVSEHKVRLG